MTLILRSTPTCPHCFAENPGAYIREIVVDGVRARCAVCNWDLGDAKSLEIPHTAAEVYKLLVGSSAFRVSHWMDDTVDANFLGHIHFNNRLLPSVKANLDWSSGKDAWPVAKEIAIDTEKLKASPAFAQSLYAKLCNAGLVCIEACLDPQEGRLRFRYCESWKVQGSDGTTREGFYRGRVELWWLG